MVQFGGKYMAHSVRIIPCLVLVLLVYPVQAFPVPRRNIKCKIDKDGMD